MLPPGSAVGEGGFLANGDNSRQQIERNEIFSPFKFFKFFVNLNKFLGHPTAYKKLPTLPKSLHKYLVRKKIITYVRMAGF